MGMIKYITMQYGSVHIRGLFKTFKAFIGGQTNVNHITPRLQNNYNGGNGFLTSVAITVCKHANL